MNVNELLDTIEDTLEESTSMPLSGGKRLVDVGGEERRDIVLARRCVEQVPCERGV